MVRCMVVLVVLVLLTPGLVRRLPTPPPVFPILRTAPCPICSRGSPARLPAAFTRRVPSSWSRPSVRTIRPCLDVRSVAAVAVLQRWLARRGLVVVDAAGDPVLRDTGAMRRQGVSLSWREGQPSGWPANDFPHGRARQSPEAEAHAEDLRSRLTGPCSTVREVRASGRSEGFEARFPVGVVIGVFRQRRSGSSDRCSRFR